MISRLCGRVAHHAHERPEGKGQPVATELHRPTFFGIEPPAHCRFLRQPVVLSGTVLLGAGPGPSPASRLDGADTNLQDVARHGASYRNGADERVSAIALRV